MISSFSGRLKVTTLVSILLILPLLLAVLIGLKQFEIWDQITYLWAGRTNPIELLDHVTPHSLRYALMYPILVFAETYDLNQDQVFSFAVVAMCFLTGQNILATTQVIDAEARKKLFATIIVMATTVVIFFMMNGRISIAFFGYSMLLKTLAKIHYLRMLSWKSPIVLIFGIFLSGVSSGTLFSAMGTLTIAVAFELGKALSRFRINKTSLILTAAALLGGYVFLDFVLVGVEKNLLFFGGGYNGFLEMLNHGFGRVLYPLLIFFSLPALIFSMLLFFASISFLVSRFTHSFLLHVTFGTVAFGAFGFSTLTLAFIPIMALLGVKIRRVRL